jgi:gamma-glutamylputrescine oxidase
MAYTSPISPGVSWYEATVGPRPTYPALDGDAKADVVIIGGGFTGLSAAAHLAKSGVDVVLIDANRFGDGASGRNGGQLGTGQRGSLDDMEAAYGWTRAKALFDLAEEAKAHLLEFARVNACRDRSRSRTRSAMSTTTADTPTTCARRPATRT